ncbi:hypothetical protein K491DRAFT_715230 [Lophiostoma macrostomum CBS 122681]|uniref:Glutaredoxin-like protein n=1 Tax=Lophiostoma macrostomum CBS 122681 TaxID=1314788 RepID=A0A6A6TA35_9PLEO|nr:hypothetical protein K491DRAFT_715230 [Lophiostoma macrostomum CBS 122681]
MFRVTSRLLDCRVTLFMRANCSLCDTAKAVVGKVNQNRPLSYSEINVMEPGQEGWKSVYEFDTPVIHVDKGTSPETTTSSRKLMHRFEEADVQALMDAVEAS